MTVGIPSADASLGTAAVDPSLSIELVFSEGNDSEGVGLFAEGIGFIARWGAAGSKGFGRDLVCANSLGTFDPTLTIRARMTLSAETFGLTERAAECPVIAQRALRCRRVAKIIANKKRIPHSQS